MRTPPQRAKSLLNLHGGCCSVRTDHVLFEAFQEMEKAGEVVLVFNGGLVNIYTKENADAFLARYGKPIN